MPDYRFNGPYPAYYPDLGRDVRPGDTITADAPPGDGNWVEVEPEPDTPVTPRIKRSS